MERIRIFYPVLHLLCIAVLYGYYRHEGLDDFQWFVGMSVLVTIGFIIYVAAIEMVAAKRKENMEPYISGYDIFGIEKRYPREQSQVVNGVQEENSYGDIDDYIPEEDVDDDDFNTLFTQLKDEAESEMEPVTNNIRCSSIFTRHRFAGAEARVVRCKDFTAGRMPVFERAFSSVRELPAGTTVEDARLVETEGKSFLDVVLMGERRTALIEDYEVAWYEETDKEGRYLYDMTTLAPLVMECFGREIPYLLKGCEIENEEDIVTKEGCHPEMMRSNYDVLDYSVEIFDECPLKVVGCWVNKDWFYYRINLTVSYNRGELYMKEKMTDDEVMNFLERNGEGRFTQRMTAKQVAAKHFARLLPNIHTAVMMYEDGIPEWLINKRVNTGSYTIYMLKTFFLLEREKYRISILPATVKEEIRNVYSKGMIDELCRKYGYGYGIMYKILYRQIRVTCELPQKYAGMPGVRIE